MKNAMRFIDEQIAQQGITAKQMAKRMGVDATMFSKFRLGLAHDVTIPTLEKMQKGISTDPVIQASLLCAYLLDRRQGVGAPLVDVSIREKSRTSVLREEPHKPTQDIYDRLAWHARHEAVDDKVANALISIIKLVNKNRHLRSVIIDLAKIEGIKIKARAKS